MRDFAEISSKLAFAHTERRFGFGGYLCLRLAPGSTKAGIYANAGTFEAVLYDEGHIGNNLWGDAPTQKVILTRRR